jgi:galactosylceramidase
VRAPTDKAKNSGKPLWSNEHHCYVWNPWQNAMYCARGNNGNYIDDKITCTLNWLGLDAAYAGAGFFKYTCLLQADQPQSGYYLVQPMTWAYAHTTQFTEIGWKYLDAACGQFVSGNRNGTYVTLRDTGSNNWSTIITTQAATSLTAAITGGLSSGTVYVWKSDSLAQFIQQPSITPANGSFTISLAANSIYTLTTTTGQQKGAKTIPATRPFPFPYSENYERYAVGDCLPRFHSDQRGTFEVYQSPDGRKCLRQIVPGYGNLQRAITAIGNNSWTDYDVVVDVKIDSGEVEVGGHYADYGKWCGFSLNKNGAWRMHDIWDTTVARGTVSGFNSGAWHTMRVSFKGTTMQALLDNTSLGSGTQTSKPSGLACLASTRNPNLFDNLYIGPQGTYTGIQASPGSPARDMLSIRRVAGTSRVAITYAGDDRNPASVDIYDMRGQRVRALVSGGHDAGVHTIIWDGKNEAGGAIAQGNYLIRLETAGTTMAQRICIEKNME